MTDLRVHRKDQGGLTNATVGMIYGIAGASIIGTFQQLAFPAYQSIAYRLILIAALIAQINCVYLIIRLGGSDKQSEHRAWYSRFRAGLIDNGTASHYARGVRWALTRLDWLFGDIDRRGNRIAIGLHPRAFGLLQDPAPLWTAPSYDRCVLIAATYPLLSMVIEWALKGDIEFLEFSEHEISDRYLILIALLFGLILSLKFQFYETRKELFAKYLGITLIFFSTFLLSSQSLFLICFISIAFSGLSGFQAILTAVCTSLSIALFINSDFFEDSRDIIENIKYSGLIFYTCFTFIAYIYSYFINRIINTSFVSRFYGIFILVLSILLPIFLIFIPVESQYYVASEFITLVPIFFCIIPIINAIFDWLALGLSRALLRCGLERGGLAPLWLGILDIIVSLLLMAALAIALLFVGQLFDWAKLLYNYNSNYGPFVGTRQILSGLKNDEQYIWIFVTIFSTQIPAVFNLLFGLFCLLRGVSGLNDWMLERVPESGGIGVWQRLGVSGVWSAQLFLALAIGLTGVFGLFAIALPLIDPAFGSRLINWLSTLNILPEQANATLGVPG